MKILIVDDDNTSRHIIKLLFSKYGECTLASNGIQALEAYKLSLDRIQPYDLIVLDIMMPDITGFQVHENIREIESGRGIFYPDGVKILIMTSLDDELNRSYEKKLKKNYEAYCVKTCDDSIISDKLNELGFN
jgi:two-component system chemotaxis response regulator CheY